MISYYQTARRLRLEADVCARVVNALRKQSLEVTELRRRAATSHYHLLNVLRFLHAKGAAVPSISKKGYKALWSLTGADIPPMTPVEGQYVAAEKAIRNFSAAPQCAECGRRHWYECKWNDGVEDNL